LPLRWYGPDDAVTLQRIRQIPGVTSIVSALHHIPGDVAWTYDDVLQLKEMVADAGLGLDVIESIPVDDVVKYGGDGRDRYIEVFARSVEAVGRAGIPVVCYNFMPVFDWMRTDLNRPNSDGSWSLAYDEKEASQYDHDRPRLHRLSLTYAAVIVGIGLWVSREKPGHEKDTSDYFLAGKMLPWWAIGASLIASNISAEQFIGMSGSGFRVGLAIASYEWMAAITLLLIAWLFLPIYLEKGIFTMPQFLEKRFDGRVRTLLAVFWLLVYVFVNLTSVLYLGALALERIMDVQLFYGIAGLALFATVYSIYGGLKAVAWTDVVQVIVLIGGGLLTTFLALNAYSGGTGAFAGLWQLIQDVPDRFQMILQPGDLLYTDDLGQTQDAYQLLPSIGVLIGGMWVANFFYWGCNQYIIQRALAAKSLKEAQRGLVFAAGLKLLLPLVVVLPGIVAFALDARSNAPIRPIRGCSERTSVPGLRGLAFAALAAAIVSSLASMMNSTATIFTMDIYKTARPESSEKRLVTIGRLVSLTAIVIAALVAYPLLGTVDQVFQYIQEYTGYISPGVLAVFVLGLFWRKATANAALITAVLSIPLSAGIAALFPAVPFLNRMGIVFAVSVVLMVIISLGARGRMTKRHRPRGHPEREGPRVSGRRLRRASASRPRCTSSSGEGDGRPSPCCPT
jgi:solute:Na+ symporter, SSS family